jgi:hypothetical protein
MSTIVTDESWINESIQESLSMSASGVLPVSHRSQGSSNKKQKRLNRLDNSGSKVVSASKISSELIPEEEHESSIIDEMLPSGTLESQG